MAAGDLIVANYQYEFNGLLFGSQTPYTTTKVDGLLSLPSGEANDTDKTLEHGSIPGRFRLQKRVVSIDLHVVGSALSDTLLDAAKKAFQGPPLYNPREQKQFVFQRPGKAKQYFMARCERRDFSSTFDVAMGHASGSVQIVGHDPVIYSLALSTNTATIATSGTVSPNMAATNSGDHPDGVSPTLRMDGPARNPQVTRSNGNGTPVLTTAIDIDIAAGEYLFVDCAKKTAQVFNASTNAFLREAFGNVRLDSNWFTILPGSNQIYYTRSNVALTGAASVLTVQWRSGWS